MVEWLPQGPAAGLAGNALCMRSDGGSDGDDAGQEGDGGDNEEI